MKKLTIEQKAKAYDEALKVLHKYDGANIMFSQSLKEEMFPELKESEDENADERIRKALTKLVTNYPSMDLFIEYDIHLDEVLAYLEKRGEYKPAWSEEDKEMHRKCICAMSASACGFPEEEKFVEQVDNWLKSLKYRVQSK